MSADILRASIFLGLILVLMLAEHLWPRRQETAPRKRWWANLGIFLMGALVTRALAIVGAGTAAIWASNQGFGLFNTVPASPIIAIAASIALLDLAIWGQHVASHKLPLLWWFHRMHHSDTQVDVTTALRFHPTEIAASLLYKSALVLLIGAPLIAVIIFELLLNSAAMFNHSNLKLSQRSDRILRIFIVTPDMHRVHHSVHKNETNSNYGFFLSIWDRLFRTYIAQPQDGHEHAKLGLSEFRDQSDQKFLSLLVQPFASKRSE